MCLSALRALQSFFSIKYTATKVALLLKKVMKYMYIFIPDIFLTLRVDYNVHMFKWYIGSQLELAIQSYR